MITLAWSKSREDIINRSVKFKGVDTQSLKAKCIKGRRICQGCNWIFRLAWQVLGYCEETWIGSLREIQTLWGRIQYIERGD